MTRTEEKISEMLKENTGRHMLDSGGAYGRHWERNQDRNFADEPATTLEFGSGIDITHNLYHWLSERLEYDEEMDNRFQDYVNLPENEDDSWGELIGTFMLSLGTSDVDTVNTYNGEDCLSQIIQYTRFTHNDYSYVILQIHGGCDARGGYGTPTIFAEDEYGTLFDNARATIRCTRSDVDPNQMELPGIHIDRDAHWWDTEDGGYSWHPENTSYNLEDYEISHDEEDRGNEMIYVDEDGKGYCPICGSLLVVY